MNTYTEDISDVKREGTTLTVPFELGQESNGYLFHSFENVNFLYE